MHDLHSRPLVKYLKNKAPHSPVSPTEQKRRYGSLAGTTILIMEVGNLIKQMNPLTPKFQTPKLRRKYALQENLPASLLNIQV